MLTEILLPKQAAIMEMYFNRFAYSFFHMIMIFRRGIYKGESDI